jgi:uncharacterized protein YndB with AHSA1/START domain
MAKSLKVEARGDREIVMAWRFDAQRRLVFDAWTKPALLMRWFGGPRDWNLTACQVDLRVGGAYRFVTTRNDGMEMGWGGVYREVVAPERLVFTEIFDNPWYPGEAIITQEFDEAGGATIFTTTILHATSEARDAVLKSPMKKGVTEGCRRLDEFLEAARAAQQT